MPTYVYACAACDTVFEIEQRITEDALDTCQCGSKGTVKRVIQPVGISFKGSGFHINDYSSSTSSSKPKDGSDDPIPAEKEKPATPVVSTETTPGTSTPSTPAAPSGPTTSSE